MRPYPRAVVAGAGGGRGRLPPSTLYMRVLALKVGPCLSPVANTHVAEIRDDQRVEQVGAVQTSLPQLPVERRRIDHKVSGYVADHLNLDLPLGEIPPCVVAGERIVITPDHDRLDRLRLSVLHDAEGGTGGGGSVAV